MDTNGKLMLALAVVVGAGFVVAGLRTMFAKRIAMHEAAEDAGSRLIGGLLVALGLSAGLILGIMSGALNWALS